MITEKELAAKMNSKKEIYRFLSSEFKCYLDSYQNMTIWHLRDLASGARMKILSSKVKVIAVPQFEGLTIENMLEFARRYP